MRVTPSYWINEHRTYPDLVSQRVDLLFKRIFDVFVSACGLILLFPFFLIIAVVIKIDSPGPIFFKGKRAGRNSAAFSIYKFRTMFETEASYRGPKITCETDERITRVGHWLRDTKVNEFPQLWNVLKGDMSLVGPRPEDPDLVAKWSEKDREEILSLRPGITSPASVIYHNEEKLISKFDIMGSYLQEILPDKIRLDLLYVHYRSFFTDLDILFLTAAILIPRIVEHPILENLFFAGWINTLANRFLAWLVTDFFIAFVGIGISGIFFRKIQPLNWGFGPLIAMAVLVAGLFGAVNAFMRLDKVLWARATLQDALKLILSSGSVTLLIAAVNYSLSTFEWLDYPALPAEMIFTFGLFATLGFLLTRFRKKLASSLVSGWSALRNSSYPFGERVLIVGSGENSQFALWLLKQNYFKYAFSVIGLASDDPKLVGMSLDGYKVLGETKDIKRLVSKNNIGLIICTLTGKRKNVFEKLTQQLGNKNSRLIYFDEIMENIYKGLLQPVTELDFTTWSNLKQEKENYHE